MKKKATSEERIAAYVEAEAELLKKYRLKRRIVITFRKHTKPPLLGRFAVWLLTKCKANTEVLLTDSKSHG